MTLGPFEERDVYIDMPVGPHVPARQAWIHGPSPGFKLIQFRRGQYQVFDLGSDPEEKNDLARSKEGKEMYQQFQLFQSRIQSIDAKSSP